MAPKNSFDQMLAVHQQVRANLLRDYRCYRRTSSLLKRIGKPARAAFYEDRARECRAMLAIEGYEEELLHDPAIRLTEQEDRP